MEGKPLAKSGGEIPPRKSGGRYRNERRRDPRHSVQDRADAGALRLRICLAGFRPSASVCAVLGRRKPSAASRPRRSIPRRSITSSLQPSKWLSTVNCAPRRMEAPRATSRLRFMTPAFRSVRASVAPQETGLKRTAIGWQYQTADNLAVLPENDDSSVECLAKALG